MLVCRLPKPRAIIRAHAQFKLKILSSPNLSALPVLVLQVEDDCDSSAHTSAAASSVAATDSDDPARLEDTAMGSDDFDFSMEPTAPAPHEGRTSTPPPTTVGDESSLDSDCCGRSLSPTIGPARTLSTSAGVGSEEGRARGRGAALVPPPPIEEQVSLMRELMEKELNTLKAGQSRFLVGLRFGTAAFETGWFAGLPGKGLSLYQLLLGVGTRVGRLA